MNPKTTLIQKIVKALKHQRLLILGFGREGKSALDFLTTYLPEAEITIADRKTLPKTTFSGLNVAPKIITGHDYLRAAKDADLIIKSPGVVIKNYLNDAEKAKITSISDLFLQFCDNPIIGVTGTKGKSTTASLIHHILKSCGKNSLLVGNIGTPCLDAINQLTKNTIVVFELSSHQLEFVHASPKIAILLNLYEEHLDHYLSATAYFSAKKNIYKFQNANDTLIYGDIFQHTSHAEIDYLPMHKINLSRDLSLTPDDIKTQLIGEHNFRNIYAAIAAVKSLGISETDAIKAVASFRGLPHRLEYVGNFRGINFYNDSIATASEAVINAVKSLQHVDTLILGGMDRGLDYHPLVNFLRSHPVRHILLLPNTVASFQRIFEEAPYSGQLIPVKDLAEAVEKAYALTAKNHICLLSPAAASYGFYKNFEERGEDFCHLVRAGANQPVKKTSPNSPRGASL